MSGSEHTLSIETDDQIAEIAVYDGNLNAVARRIGRLQEKLPAGLYKIVVRVGSATDEKLAALDRDQTIKLGPLPFSTPIPLQRTGKTHEYHMAAAAEASRASPKALGSGASIMVFAREWSAAGNKSDGNPAQGLSLLDSQENLLAEIWKEVDLRSSGDASAGWRADVDPGGYFLRLELDDADKTVLLRPIYVSPGHQLQIFCLVGDHLVEEGDKRKFVRRANLAGAAIFISARGSFDPDDRRARLSELACRLLAQSRGGLPQSLIDDLISEKSDNPMLGLFCAHLLLRDCRDDKELFRTVTDNLLRLLGPDHPDLQALWWQRVNGSPLGDGRLHVLPMMRASWSLAVDRSIKSLDVFSLGTFYDKLTRIVPSAPWLMLMDNDWAVSEDAIDDYLKARKHAYFTRAQAELALRAQAMGKQYFRRTMSVVRDSLPTAVAAYIPAAWTMDVVAGPTASQDTATTESIAPALESDEKAALARTLAIPVDMLESILQRKGR
jgi:hypothetical protein